MPNQLPIIYAYNPDVRPECQVEAQAAMARLAGAGWEVWKVDCKDSVFRYAEALGAGWGYRSFINVEQDIVITEAQARALAACRYPLCTIPYRLKDGHWSLWSNGRLEAGTTISYYNQPGAWARGSALGAVKISAVIQRQVRLPGTWQWDEIDIRLNNVLADHRIIWHVHQDQVKHIRPNVD